MKNSFSKFIKVAFIYMNATFIFSQSVSNIDDSLKDINRLIEKEYYQDATVLIDSLRMLPEYSVVSEKLKVDLVLAKLHKIQSNNEEALKVLLNGLTVINGNTSSKYLAEYAYEIGSEFSRIKNYSKAFKYFRLVLSNSLKRSDSLGISRGNLGVGSVHLHLYQDMSRGLKESDSISLNMHKDSMQYYYDTAILFAPKNDIGNIFLADVYANLVVYNYYEADYDIAEVYGLKSLDIHKSNKDSIKMARLYNLLGAISLGKKDYDKAIKFYDDGLLFVESKRNRKAIDYRQRFYENLAGVYYLLDNFKWAYEYNVMGAELRDSLNLINSNLKIVEFEAKYNLSEKEKLAEVEKNKRQKAEVWMYVLGISSIVLLSFLWLYSRSQKHKREKQELEFQREHLLKERELERIQKESQIKILNATIDGKEAERRHIAEILHDSVSALLSSAGLHLQAAKIELKEKAPEEIQKTQEIVNEAGDKIRNLSHKLISAVLLKFGLSYAIEDLCDKYSNSSLGFQCKSNDLHRFDQDFEIKIHNIIEELMNNIMKHSDAEKAQVLLKQQDGELQVRIFDDGKGFDVEKIRTQNSSGLGLTQIEARIKMMQGVFTMASSKKAGTRIFIHVPIPDEN